jgi:hypothetical protein
MPLQILPRLMRYCQFNSGKTARLAQGQHFPSNIVEANNCALHHLGHSVLVISRCSMTIMPFVVWTAISTGLVSLMFAPWPKGTTQKDQDES